MSKLTDAAQILRDLGLPPAQQNERSALTLLALAALGPRSRWSAAQGPMLRTCDVIAWIREKFDVDYAANTRESVRRQTIHQFEQARLVDLNPDKPERPTTSPKTVYRLTPEALEVIRLYGDDSAFTSACNRFKAAHGELDRKYRKVRDLAKIPITLPDGIRALLSPGPHNELQRLIVNEFCGRFACDSDLIYLGDTANKRLYRDEKTLERLRIPELNRDKLPDVVLYDATRQWLFLIEAVTSHGPVSAKRHAELESMFAECPAARIYITAFPDLATFKKYAADLAWESEVWIADAPDHMIHFNGEKFLGPYLSPSTKRRKPHLKRRPR
jgi:hypothetical protein